MNFPAFNPLTAPLSRTSLIEASAGTGKTWNIAALFTRLILLEQLDVSQILVLTFTKAATAELKTRLRARLDDALRLLRQTPDADADSLHANSGGDAFLTDLLVQALQQEEQERLILRLQAAAGSFDRAAVYTIHGFCQRVLQDYAFFCQVPFQIEPEEGGNRAAQQAAAQDFWRSRVADDPLLAALVYRNRSTPQQRLAELMPFLGRPYLHGTEDADLATARQRYADAVRALHETWRRIGGGAGLRALADTFWALYPQLNKNSFREPSYRSRFEALSALGDAPPDAAVLLPLLSAADSKTKISYCPFHTDNLTEKARKGVTLDTDKVEKLADLDELYQAAAAVSGSADDVLAALDLSLLAYLRQAHAEQKKYTPKREFDDLLLDVYHALQQDAPHAADLAQALSAAWRVALIDEFQDTDPLQYAVFRAAFAATDTPLFLVGDPKQAIYSFRGADIFAYLQAAEDVRREQGQRYGLDTNRRSHAALIDAVSRLFARTAPFVLPEIAYPPVSASRADGRLAPAPEAALCLRWLNEGADKETAAVLESRAAAWCADEIAALLLRSRQDGCRLNGRRLAAADVAVLVRRRRDGALVQRELKKRGVQSVLLSQNNVFAEEEAEALAALLDWFVRPQQTGVLRFVLAGCLFDWDAAQLAELNADEMRLQTWLEAAEAALAQWTQFGAYAALQQFFRQHGVESRLLAQGRERTLTNLHQLMELLAAEDELSHSPAALQQWLVRRIQAAKNREDGAQENTLRLESDEDLVKIVTVHASKGLQYPIVFCPFVWKAASDGVRQTWSVLHSADGARLLHRNTLAQQPQWAEQARHEALSEDLRLLYVALTRAEEQLHLYVGHYSDSAKSALAYLLEAGDAAKDAAAYRSLWQAFAADTAACGWYESAPPPTRLGADRQNATAFQAACFAPRRFRFVRHTSFTGLMRRQQQADTDSDGHGDSVLLPETAAESDADSIHAFPQGTTAGVCLHAVLEHELFTAADPARLAKRLAQYGFETERWLPALAQMLERVRQTPLLADGRGAAAFAPDCRITEMDFLLHTDDFAVDKVRRWFAAGSLPDSIKQAAQHLDFHDVRGYLSGFIDLLCWDGGGSVVVADYKSNRLGASAADYTAAALNGAVAEHHYYLQALIYAVAAARYCRFRGGQPETVSVRYLFLRGLDGTGGGVWAWDIRLDDLQPWL